MSRFPLRFAAVLLCGTALCGCETFGGSSTATLTGAPAPSAASASNPNNSVATNLDAEIARAQLLRANGQTQEANQALSQLMLVAPDDARVVGEYGKLLAQQGRAQDAVAFLQRAIELAGNDYTLFSALGVAQDQLGNQDAAKSAYDIALKLKPGDAMVLNNYALSRMLAHDPAGAHAMMAQARAADTANAKIARNEALIAKMMPVPAASAAAAAAPMAAAAPAQPVASAKPVVTVKPVASVEAKPLPAPAADTAPTPLVQVAPGVLSQRPPVDPKAGPVAPTKPETVTAKKPAPKKDAVKDGVPALRRTADASSG